MDRVLSWAREQQRRLILLNALPVQALLAARHGKWEEAEHILEEALEIARIVPSRYDEPIILYTAGLISLQQGKSAQARASFEAALTICHQLGERRYAVRIEQALAVCPSD